ncbi:hypothetical protein HRG_009172 [Hirsutella rhossiliensis]|uniref:Uncharacterized protein n=1 Tax=Hirsutella rhossiliensis TaxID=111463 RepID=A0A9P8SEX8_9HYPO|nr:uncharacterized protein HRG_09172 [Hirsutella rhossiliensis]KAH0960151.1 hypothetical protein HRG_09172 [Hirsutella rhossiliensis]
MEEQASAASTPPPTNRRDIPSARPTPTPQPVLSSSEPFLRFPRPQGNRRLANWISASDPDIMRLTTATEDTGLAESTYELITGTDSESQDGNYTESMGDSVGSLDPHRPDDVHSLDGTEYTHDGESLADDVDVLPRTPSYEGVDESNDDEAQRVDENDDTLVAQDHNPDDPEIRDEACSRSSLEYTQHSLGTPSISTPEVSKLAGIPSLDFQLPGQPPAGKPESHRARSNNRLAHLWQVGARVKDYVVETTSAALIPLLFTAALAAWISVMDHNLAENSRSHPSTVVSTVTATTTSIVVSTARPSSRARPRPPSAGGMGLIPLRDGTSDEWLFGARKPSISFTPQAQTDILVHVPGYVKQAWLARDCLAVNAVRDGRQVETSSSPVDEGILLRFPKKEAYGVVSLSLEATCRPRVQRMVKVHFGKGVMEEALEMTRNLAHDLSGLVPAVAQEAERCFEGARRSLGAVSDSVVFVSDDLLGRLDNALSGARQSLGGAKANAQSRIAGATEDFANNLGAASRQAKEQLNRVRDVQSQLQLVLLDARISAKLWWLDATGRKDEHDDYQRKAKEFVAKKHAAAKEAGRARRHQVKVETGSQLWPRMLRQGRCH